MITRMSDEEKKNTHDYYKSFITNEKSTIDKRGESVFQQGDLNKYIFTSGNPNPFCMDSHDRRFFVLKNLDINK